MKKLSAILAALAMGALSVTPALAFDGTGDHNCPDFVSQAAAQAYFEANSGSASNNFDGLDRDNDGVACENQGGYADGARDETPAAGAVAAPTAAPGTVPDVAMAPPSAQWPALTAAIIALLVMMGLLVRRFGATTR